MFHPMIYRVSTIQGGAGFLPSTVCEIFLWKMKRWHVCLPSQGVQWSEMIAVFQTRCGCFVPFDWHQSRCNYRITITFFQKPEKTWGFRHSNWRVLSSIVSGKLYVHFYKRIGHDLLDIILRLIIHQSSTNLFILHMTARVTIHKPAMNFGYPPGTRGLTWPLMICVYPAYAGRFFTFYHQ